MTAWCPHVTIHPDTRAALDEHAPGWTGHKLDPGDPGAYSRWMVDRWAASVGFTIVEHDIVIHAEVLPGFAACPRPWCTYPYPGPARTTLTESLGCTRFRAELLADAPDAAREAATVADADLIPPGDWRRLDVRLATVLRARGQTAHVHEPPVEHRHHYANEPCCCGCST